MKKIFFYLLILFVINICALTFTLNYSAMATAPLEIKERAPEEENTKKTDKLTIEKNAKGTIIIHQNPTWQKKPTQ